MDAVGAFCGCGSGKHRFFSCCEHTDSPYRRYGTRRLLRCNKLVSSYDLISAVKTLCVQNLQSGTDLPEFQRLLLPRSAREGEVAFSKKMTEGMCSKFQSAPKPAAFGSPQALRASSPCAQGEALLGIISSQTPSPRPSGAGGWAGVGDRLFRICRIPDSRRPSGRGRCRRRCNNSLRSSRGRAAWCS